jgi:membrane protease YdiL (CAAX protease family)
VAAAKARKSAKPAKAAAKPPAKRSANAARSAKPAKPAKTTRPAGPAAAAEAEVPAAGSAPAGPAGPVAQAPAGPAVAAAQRMPAPARPRPAFDPATGDWIRMPDSPPGPVQAPPTVPPLAAAPGAPDDRRPPGAVYTMWSILLWIDLALIAFSVVAAIVFGLVLYFAPGSDLAQSFRDTLSSGDQADLVANTVLTFISFGVIPLLWVAGTRRRALEGTKRFLHLHEPGKGILRGVALAIPLLVGVVLLITLYTLATEGVDGLVNADEESNPAVQEVLDNLTWPIAILVAVCAGVGEEIFFRGFLQRYIGVWGQGIMFGLAHSTGGYPPQVVFAFGLGILFGFLVKRGWSLWSLIVAHALYDFTLLALALLAPEFG